MNITLSFVCASYFLLRQINIFFRLKNKDYKYKRADTADEFDIIMMAIYLLVS